MVYLICFISAIVLTNLIFSPFFPKLDGSAGNRLQFAWSIIRPFLRAMIDP